MQGASQALAQRNQFTFGMKKGVKRLDCGCQDVPIQLAFCPGWALPATLSTNCGSAEMGKKELEETSQSDPASDFAPQNPEQTQRGKETVPIRSLVQRLRCTASIFLWMALGT
eukprot:s3254_g3.t1